MHCKSRVTLARPHLIEDAAQAAAAGGFNFSGIDGISVLSTFCDTSPLLFKTIQNECSGGWKLFW
jgi:hypothetical protein